MAQLLENQEIASKERPLSVLLIETKIGDFVDLRGQLESQNLRVNQVGNDWKSIEEVLRKGPDAIVISAQVQSMECSALCARIGELSDAPVVLLAEAMTEDQRIAALDNGADDCMSQPVSWRELAARLGAHVRRGRLIRRLGRREINLGDLSIDTCSMRATMNGKYLSLTTFEFELLRVFAERAGHVLTRDFLMSTMRGANYGAFDRSIDVHVSRLRGKIGDSSRNPRWLKTVRGAGYLMARQES